MLDIAYQYYYGSMSGNCIATVTRKCYGFMNIYYYYYRMDFFRRDV